MKLLQKVLRMFCVSEELTQCQIIVTDIAVSVVALIYLSFVASLLVFHHWSVTTMECLLLVYVGLEIKMYWLLRKNSVKLLRMYDHIEQMYHQLHYDHIRHHYHHQDHESKLDLSALYFLASSFSFVSIHLYFYTTIHNDLINNILSVGKILPLFYLNVILTKRITNLEIDIVWCKGRCYWSVVDHKQWHNMQKFYQYPQRCMSYLIFYNETSI